MRILYGVVGEGMGHATRSRVVIEHLASRGHAILVVVSGRAHEFLRRAFADEPLVAFNEIHGLCLRYAHNRLRLWSSLGANLKSAPGGILKNIEAYYRLLEDGFAPELVISDFDSWTYLYAKNHRLPVISIDNMQVLNRARHSPNATGNQSRSFRLAKAAVKAKLPGAYHYLVSSFFYPQVRKPRTTLVPPILRPEVLAAQRQPQLHVVVYQRAMENRELMMLLRQLDCEFRIYGADCEGVEGNVTFCPFSEDGFIGDLRTARAVIAGGGFSLMSEAVHLGVPMLAVPINGQFEQEINARYLAKLGFGSWAPALTVPVIQRFHGLTDYYTHNLQSYPRHDNTMLLRCVDELLWAVDMDEPAPARLTSPAMGKLEVLPWPDGLDLMAHPIAA